MAAFVIEGICMMMSKPNNSPVRVSGQPRLPPVRVKLLRQDAYMAQTRPPDGDSKDWWQRLNKALGTTSSDFVNASLFQLQAAARSPLARFRKPTSMPLSLWSRPQRQRTKLKERSLSRWPVRTLPLWRFLPKWKVPSHQSGGLSPSRQRRLV